MVESDLEDTVSSRLSRPYPIRFRAWEHKSKVMLDWLCLRQTAFNRGDSQLLYNVATDPDYRFAKMLFTGLYDRNGKSIFEGDIVTAVNQGYKATFEIRWRQEGTPCWLLYPAWQNREMWYLHGSRNHKGEWVDDGVEVIGNIYETPHLRPKPEAT